MSSEETNQQPPPDVPAVEPPPTEEEVFYHQIQFRPAGQFHSAATTVAGLDAGQLVLVQTDHGPEPARLKGVGIKWQADGEKTARPPFSILRQAGDDEVEKFARLLEREQEAFAICQQKIEQLSLAMKLIQVERYSNGSKIIFYFTAENRVDFRELVKALVQEFRTRVEMRQIGVRHETKLIGGLGCCGRELCCASYITNFAPVSIKMAKEQDVPLNPAKISGICNRLLCCLTYEFDAYRQIKKKMPRPGKTVKLHGQTLKVMQCNVLQETVTVMPPGEPEKTQTLNRKEWEAAKPLQQPPPQKPKKGKK